MAATFINTCIENYHLWERNMQQSYGDVEIAVCMQLFGIFPRKVCKISTRRWWCVHLSVYILLFLLFSALGDGDSLAARTGTVSSCRIIMKTRYV